MKQLPVVLCIDVEPDDREVAFADGVDWTGFERTAAHMQRWRPRLEEATGAPVRFNWYLRMDPQIFDSHGDAAWVVRRYRELFAQFDAQGDAFGLHVHAWRWHQPAERWVVDHGDPAWVAHCVDSAFTAYRGAFGRPCTSFRFGDHWMSDATVAQLAALGVQHDLTLEPGVRQLPALREDELFSGALPDYTAVPRRPYRPSRHDYRRAGADAHPLWMLPLSTGRPLGRFAALKRLALDLGIDLQRRHQATPLFLEAEPAAFAPVFDHLTRLRRRAYVAPVFRVDACDGGPRQQRLDDNLESICRHAAAKRLRFTTPGDALAALGCASRAAAAPVAAPAGDRAVIGQEEEPLSA